MAAKTDIIKIGSHHDEVQVGQLKECVQQLVRDEAKSMFLERCEDRLGILELGQILQAFAWQRTRCLQGRAFID